MRRKYLVEIDVLISEISVKCTLRCCPAGVSSLCLGTLFLIFLLISVSVTMDLVRNVDYQDPVQLH